jgi:hypothetical protein
MEYDLERIFDHPLMLGDLLPAAISVFGGLSAREYRVDVRWRASASGTETTETLVIRWDLDRLERRVPELRKKIENLIGRDLYQALQTENAAVVVTVAVLENVAPGTRFSMRSDKGSYHDYFLNESLEEMVEVAGRGSSKKGLDALFLEEKEQSDKNPSLRKRWVSITVFSKKPRNRTEGLHDDYPQQL